MQKLTLALDWTPNINHIGFFVAQALGFYKAEDLQVEILDPATDDYQTTPAKKVELGQADFALCPTESIISYQTKSKPFNLIAIAAILQKDLSAIVIKKGVGINSPKDLDGKLYASYQARYEDQIVKQMIVNDGGKGNITVEYPKKLGIWNTLLTNACDATWIFMNWEGVEAKAKNLPLHYFKMQDYKVPYSYSPVLAANAAAVTEKSDAYRKFLQATKKGFLHCATHSTETAEILKNVLPEKDKHIDLLEAIKISVGAFGDEKNWGNMDEKVVGKFLEWIYSNELERQTLAVSDLVTNELL